MGIKLINHNHSFTRLFVAIDVPQNVKDEVIRIQQDLRLHTLCEGKFTEPAGIHITLKFIGEVTTDQIELINYALNIIQAPQMTIFLDKLDIFTRGPIVKIILMRINAAYISDLMLQIERCLLPWVPAGKRDYIPHLTLVRVKKVSDVHALMTYNRETYAKPLPFTVDHFVLKQSVLTIEGPVYIDIAHFNLI